MRWRLVFILIPVIALILALTLIIFKINEDRLIQAVQSQELERVQEFTAKVVREYDYVRSIFAYLVEQNSIESVFVNNGQRRASALTADVEEILGYLILSQADLSALVLIDKTGKSLIDIEQFGQKVISNDNRDVSQSRAFQNALTLDKNDIYASLMHLETYQGKVIAPSQPTIDFFSPVYGQAGKLHGLIKLSYDASSILDHLNRIESRSGAHVLLSNANGHFLKAHKQTNQWDFQLDNGQDKTLKAVYGSVWKRLQASDGPQFELNSKLYTAMKICDRGACKKQAGESTVQLDLASLGMPWTVVSELDLQKVLADSKTSARWYLVYAMIGILGAIALLSGYGGWRLISANASLERARRESSGKDKLFSTFIDGNPSLVYAKNIKGQYVIVNDAYARFLEQTPDNLLGKSDFDLENVNVEQISKHITQEQLVLHSGDMTVSDESWLSQKQKKTNFVVTRFPVDIDGDNETDMVGVIAVDVTERDMAKSEMAQKEALFKTLVNSSPNAIVIVNNEGRVSFANRETSHLFGWQIDELMDKPFDEMIPDDFSEYHSAIQQRLAKNDVDDTYSTEHQMSAVTKHGEKLDVEVTLSPIKINQELMTMAIVRDVTGKLKMESHMRQSQKMEAIGHLTGGVAHDFNNLLGVIIGNLDLLSSMYPDDSKAQKRIEGALKASLSGAELTKRLLAFARKQTLNPEVIDIATGFEEMIPILDRTLKGEVELKIDVPDTLSKVFIDNGEFENVVLNMGINARDAMPNGGILTIGAEEVDVDEEFIKSNDEAMTPGQYIHISISDTGAGMPPDVIKHIFEPFYTTKEKGKGTGLGLAMAHGFVKQSKGLIKVYSEIDVGTTFHIYLPVADPQEHPTASPLAIPSEIPKGNGETILIVDDEADLAEIASAYLVGLGYQTLTVHSGETALDLLDETNEVKLVLTDIVMPGGMDGVELHKRIHERFPSIHVVYASGFSADALTNKRGHEITADLIQKPYRKQNLAFVIRRNLDAGPA